MMKTKGLIILLILIMLLTGCSNDVDPVNDDVKNTDDGTTVSKNQDDDEINTDPNTETISETFLLSIEDIDSFIETMTLEEKAGQLIQAERGSISLKEIIEYNIGSVLSGGGSTPSKNNPEGWVDMYNNMQMASRESSSGIPLIYGIDAVHGHSNLSGAIIFPHNIGLGAANNLNLMEKIGRVTAEEVLATGLDWNFSPCVSVVQDLRWGRSYESYSESGEMVAALGAAYLIGLENAGIVSTTKHFIGDGFTEFGTGQGSNLIDRGDVTVSMEKLLEVYLPPYEAAIEAGTKSIMVSFNSINGLKMHQHKELLTDVLRGELGFEGMVISDWDGITELPGSLKEQTALAINAGIDMLMQPNNWKQVHGYIIENVNDGIISEERLNEAVRRVLAFKYEAGLFTEDYLKVPREIALYENKNVARQAVAESMVLLKNDNAVLPLDKDMKIFIEGPAMDNVGVQCGGWTLSWQGQVVADLNDGVSLQEAIEAVLSTGGGSLVDDPDEADVIVLALGEKPYAEWQGDTDSLALDANTSLSDNVKAVEKVTEYGKPVVTVLIAGRPLLVDDYLSDWDALVMAWLPGTEGSGMTDVLFGDLNFTGKLPVTWPLTNEQASDSIYIDDYSGSDYQFEFGYGLVYE